jgi:hypothetical protein
VVLQNLFSPFDPNSYTFAYLGRFDPLWRDRAKRSSCYRLIPNFHPVQYLDFIIKGIKQKHAICKAVQFAKARHVEIIVGLYPTLGSLFVATEVAKLTKAKYYPYLHDTVAEGLSHDPLADKARDLQEDVFRVADKILTMSEGMSDYYKQTYELETYPLVHSYPEQIVCEPNSNRRRSAFWGGSVYAINDQSFLRVQKALLAREIDLEVTGAWNLNIQKGTNIRQNYYASRAAYIEAIQQHGVLVLGVNWTDESVVHHAELSTIFPTKAIEYLATGSPILVHCPEHYFLARFFRKHQCGLVVSERSGAALVHAVDLLLSGAAEVRTMQSNALTAARLFSVERVSSTFRDYLG